MVPSSPTVCYGALDPPVGGTFHFGNPGGSLEATRRSFNKDFLLALAADFKKHGAAAIEKVRKTQPAAYMKICALLVPREMQIEHSGTIKQMSDEQKESFELAVCQAVQMLGIRHQLELGTYSCRPRSECVPRLFYFHCLVSFVRNSSSGHAFSGSACSGCPVTTTMVPSGFTS